MNDRITTLKARLAANEIDGIQYMDAIKYHAPLQFDSPAHDIDNPVEA